VMRQKLETAIRPREAFPRRALAFLMALAAVLTAAFAFRGLVEPTLVVAHPLFSALGFALLYTAIAALAVPVIWVMNVAAGALFGPWIGLPIAVASSVTGATITMLAARYALRGWVEARFPAAIAASTKAQRAAGARFLFAARLAPIVPFPLVNLAAGLTPIRAKTFALVSLLGVLPLSFAYVSAGAELATIQAPRGRFRPGS
jgi:uncharacterized membrane protein YdjX (TVP38/TMEM64 family)